MITDLMGFFYPSLRRTVDNFKQLWTPWDHIGLYWNNIASKNKSGNNLHNFGPFLSLWTTKQTINHFNIEPTRLFFVVRGNLECGSTTVINLEIYHPS